MSAGLLIETLSLALRQRVDLVGSKKFVEFTLSNCCSCSLPLMNFKTQRLFVSNYTPTFTTHSHTHNDRHRLDTPEACESATSVSIMSSSALSPVAQLLLPDKLNSTQRRNRNRKSNTNQLAIAACLLNTDDDDVAGAVVNWNHEISPSCSEPSSETEARSVGGSASAGAVARRTKRRRVLAIL